MRTVFRRGIALPQAIAIDEDNPAQNPPVVHTGLAVGLRKEGLQLDQQRLAQPL